MSLNWSESESSALLGAMRSVAEADGECSAGESALIGAAATHVFGRSVPVPTASVGPDELASTLSEDQHRLAAEFLVLMPYADAVLSDLEVDAVDPYAAALGVTSHALADLHKAREHHIKRLILDYGRRSAKELAGTSFAHFVVTSLHQHVGDKHLAQRYQQLEDYPEESLGWTFFHFYRARGFGLPGEPRGFGEAVVGHDTSHILAGFNTDGAGEINVAGFEAGMKRSDFGYELLMEVLLDFQLGINLGGQTVGLAAKAGELDPDQLMVGIERGLGCTVDVWRPDWDFWAVASEPVVALRERFDIVGATDVLLDPPAPVQASSVQASSVQESSVQESSVQE